MKKVKRSVRLYLSLTTCRALNRVVAPLLVPESSTQDVVHFVVDLALANLHLLRPHIAGAIRYARDNDLTLPEVISSQVAMQVLYGVPGKKTGRK